MAKKKDKPQVINNIREMNLEIDYDKLAEAIVKAQKNEDANNCTCKTKEKKSFKKYIQLIYFIVFNKKQSNGTMTSGLFSLFLSGIFNVLAILGIIVSFFGVISTVSFVAGSEWSRGNIANNISVISWLIATTIVTAAFALVFRASANELSNEQDRNYIISVFSGIVSFAALIVALVALFKGVG